MAHNVTTNYPKPVVGSWDRYMELDLCSVCSAAMIITGLPFPCNLGHRPFILEVGDDKRVGKIYTILQSLKAHNGIILRPPYSCQFLGNLLRSWLKFCPLCMAEIFADHIIFQARRTQPLKDDCNAQENSRCSYCDYLRDSGGDKKRLSLAKSKLCKDLERDASRRAFSATRMDHPFLKQLFPLLSHDYTKRMLAAVTVPQMSQLNSRKGHGRNEEDLLQWEKQLEERERLVEEREQALKDQLQGPQGLSQQQCDIWLDRITVNSHLLGLESEAGDPELDIPLLDRGIGED